jgi:hypothetical protein
VAAWKHRFPRGPSARRVRRRGYDGESKIHLALSLWLRRVYLGLFE